MQNRKISYFIYKIAVKHPPWRHVVCSIDLKIISLWIHRRRWLIDQLWKNGKIELNSVATDEWQRQFFLLLPAGTERNFNCYNEMVIPKTVIFRMNEWMKDIFISHAWKLTGLSWICTTLECQDRSSSALKSVNIHLQLVVYLRLRPHWGNIQHSADQLASQERAHSSLPRIQRALGFGQSFDKMSSLWPYQCCHYYVSETSAGCTEWLV